MIDWRGGEIRRRTTSGNSDEMTGAALSAARLARRGLAMLHWEFNCVSPLTGDKRRRFGCIDFKLERLEISEQQKALLIVSFFNTGIVGYSQRGQGWLFFSAGSGGLPELAEATEVQIQTLPRLPSEWEMNIEETD